ncbi:MAG: xanthine dehydrogenase family protein subunit M [Deltaproteobacteria bacterium]|nr:xanthine dehydrogenase family protein subunit M [Deltaproteobacteria bacterium]
MAGIEVAVNGQDKMEKYLSFREYYAPATQQEALQLLLENGPAGRLLAGGTDLLVAMRDKGLGAERLISIKKISDFGGIGWMPDGGVRIGATTTLYEVEHSAAVKRAWPVLSQAAGAIGSVQIRNLGTIGGNVANASPAADTAPALLVLDAEMEIVSASGRKIVSADRFFTAPGKTVMERGEILAAIRVPPSATGARAAYVKFAPRQAMDIAVVGVAVALKLDGDGRCREARVALGAVGPTPMRARGAEAALVGEIDERSVETAAREASAEAKPISDVRASGSYRRHLVGVLIKRAVKLALAREHAAA